MTEKEQIAVEGIIRNLENIRHKTGLSISNEIKAVKENLCDLYGVANIVLCSSKVYSQTLSQKEREFIFELAADYIETHPQP